MALVKAPAVAGTFYPGDAETLRGQIRKFLAAVGTAHHHPTPRAIIVPHAGYAYSGPVAACAYALVKEMRGSVARVVLMGPSHYLPFSGLAVSQNEAFATPLGEVPLDRAGVEMALSFRQVRPLEEAFSNEHSLEVHLPFLQETLGDFALVPLLTGAAAPEDAAAVIEALWQEKTLVVVSSDLSHFHPENAARRIDNATSCAIEAFRLDDIGPQQACGHTAVKGLLIEAQRRGFHVRTLDLRNSADTAGPASEVVGYGAFLIT